MIGAMGRFPWCLAASVVSAFAVASCGARSSLPDFDTSGDDSTGGGGPELPCSTSRNALAYAFEGDNSPEVYRVHHLPDGSFFVVGEGMLVDGCDRPAAISKGTHFLARFGPSGTLEWERRFATSSWGRQVQTALRPDGGIVLLSISSEGIVDGESFTGLASFTPAGEIATTASLPFDDPSDQALAVSPSGRVVALGRCTDDAGGVCPASPFNHALFSWDPALGGIAIAPLFGSDGAYVEPLACAFDGEALILVGKGFGSVWIGGTTIELGDEGSFFARLNPDHELMSAGVTSWLQHARVAIDPLTRDVLIAGHYSGSMLDFGGGPLPPANGATGFVARLDENFGFIHARGVEGGAPHFLDDLQVSASGEALVAIRTDRTEPTVFAGATLQPGHAALAIDRQGNATWVVSERTMLRSVSEGPDGVRFLGGNYNDFDGPPGSGASWPIDEKHHLGFLYTLPPAP